MRDKVIVRQSKHRLLNFRRSCLDPLAKLLNDHTTLRLPNPPMLAQTDRCTCAMSVPFLFFSFFFLRSAATYVMYRTFFFPTSCTLQGYYDGRKKKDLPTGRKTDGKMGKRSEEVFGSSVRSN